MTLDLYHKILMKLYEVTKGKDSQIVDLKDLVKNQGFLGSYHDIFQFLSIQGWIMETSKADYVKMTHWGLKEAKKTQGNIENLTDDLTEKANNLTKRVKELLTTVEEFATETSAENFEQLELKMDELKSAVNTLKDNF
ncbi:MAG: hypothetical protein ABI686_04145 [Acidobacteriota bacterium]